MVQVLTAQDYRSMPWKNGQGVTLEVARSHGEGLDDFDWRVSIADVKAAGPFSHFLNRQRIIGVLEGNGMTLLVDDQSPVTLQQKEFFAFKGESNVRAQLVKGAIRDFNLIYNPAKYSARLQWVNSASGSSWISDAAQILIFSTAPSMSLDVNSQPFVLKHFETLLVRNNIQPLQFSTQQSAGQDFCIIELFIK